MGLRAEIVQAAMNTANPTQIFSFPGFGTVKAIIVIAGGTTTSGTPRNDAQISVGFSDGVSNFSISSTSEDNTADSDTYRMASNTRCLAILDTAGTVLAEAWWDGLVTDGIRLDLGGSAGYAGLVTVILLGGDDLSAYVGSITSDNTVGNTVTLTDVPFEFDQMMVLGAQRASAEWDAIAGESLMQVGFVGNHAGTVVQCCAAWKSLDAAPAADDSNRVSNIYASSDPSAAPAIEIVSPTAVGFGATTRGSSGVYEYPFLALNYNGKVEHLTGVLATPTALGKQETVMAGFQPQLAIVVVQGVPTVNALANRVSSGAGSFGIAALTNQVYTTTVSDEDAAVTMNCESFSDDELVSRDGAGVYLHRATPVAMTPVGWIGDYSVANATIRRWPFLAFGQPAKVPQLDDSANLVTMPPGVVAY